MAINDNRQSSTGASRGYWIGTRRIVPETGGTTWSQTLEHYESNFVSRRGVDVSAVGGDIVHPHTKFTSAPIVNTADRDFGGSIS